MYVVPSKYILDDMDFGFRFILYLLYFVSHIGFSVLLLHYVAVKMSVLCRVNIIHCHQKQSREEKKYQQKQDKIAQSSRLQTINGNNTAKINCIDNVRYCIQLVTHKMERNVAQKRQNSLRNKWQAGGPLQKPAYFATQTHGWTEKKKKWMDVSNNGE